MSMNIFRVLADVSHTVSKCILIWAIHSNRSAEGVSLLTQLQYMVVFVTRYLDLLWDPPSLSYWNFCLKIFYITSSIYIIFLMMKVYARTREREKSWKLSAYLNGAAVVAAPILALISGGTSWIKHPFQILWSYSIIIEAFCILPQLILLRQTTVPTVIDSYYLVTLGSYRAFYIMNWIYRAAHKERIAPIKIVFGIIQVAFYIDFAWVYWTRQRVKLRGGGIVDADDLRKGFLVNRFGDNRTSLDEEAEPTSGDMNASSTNSRPTKPVNRWGNRGISISADDTLTDADRARRGDGSKALNNPDDDAFLSDEDEDAPILNGASHEVLNSDSNWRDAAQQQ